MNDQDKNQVNVKNQTQTTAPTSTSDIAKAMDTPATDLKTSPAHRVPGDTGTNANSPAPLLPTNTTDQLRRQWTDIQASFVDEPRQAVQQADALVAQTIKQLAQTFADTRSGMEAQWSQGNNVSTEDLRVALRRYRSFFDRLLSL